MTKRHSQLLRLVLACRTSADCLSTVCSHQGLDRAPTAFCALLQAQTLRGTVRLRFVPGCLATAVLVQNALRWISTPHGYPFAVESSHWKHVQRETPRPANQASLLLWNEQCCPQGELLLPKIKYSSERHNDVWTSFFTEEIWDHIAATQDKSNNPKCQRTEAEREALCSGCGITNIDKTSSNEPRRCLNLTADSGTLPRWEKAHANFWEARRNNLDTERVRRKKNQSQRYSEDQTRWRSSSSTSWT